MTREELRDYVDEQRTLNNIPYHVYSTLIDGIDTLEQEPFINKPCVSEKVCEHDKNKVLDELRAEIENHCGLAKDTHCEYCPNCYHVMGVREILEILDKYKAERKENKTNGKI